MSNTLIWILIWIPYFALFSGLFDMIWVKDRKKWPVFKYGFMRGLMIATVVGPLIYWGISNV